MDVTGLTSSRVMMGDNIGAKVGMSVYKMLQDNFVETGEMLTDMMKEMELSVNPHLGSQIDVSL